MARFVNSSKDLALDITGLTLHSAGVTLKICFLPVTIPIHVASRATNLVVGTCISVVTGVPQQQRQIEGENDNNDDYDGGPLSHLGGVIHHVANAVPNVLNAADKVKNDLGGMILGFVFGNEESPAAEQKAYLERLKLDDFSEGVAALHKGGGEKVVPSSAAVSFDVTKYLLRVDEFDLQSEDGFRVLYIDLNPEFADEELTSKALDSLVMAGFALVSNGAGQGPQNGDWKPEGNTKKFLRKQETMASHEWFDMMQSEILVWSGSVPASRYTRDAPVFLSRGFLPGSPRTLFKLLWDSSQTSTYNKFCVSRTDLLTIIAEDDESDPSNDLKSVKVVRSETKVPFTSMTINTNTLMYASRFEDGSFLVVSRSLTSGAAGLHTSASTTSDGLVAPAQNEVTWSVNWIRAVPDKPHATELITASQMCSSLVPGFLTKKVGMMATDTAFQSLRSLEVLNNCKSN